MMSDSQNEARTFFEAILPPVISNNPQPPVDPVQAQFEALLGLNLQGLSQCHSLLNQLDNAMKQLKPGQIIEIARISRMIRSLTQSVVTEEFLEDYKALFQ